MEHPPLHRQLQKQLRQWVNPKDQRHLQGYAEAIAAILQSSSACLGKWLPYLGHRNCQARAHMERLSYLVHNPHISPERFYNRLLQQALQAFEGSAVTLTLDTRMLWDQFCLVEVCVVWGGRSFTLAQTVLEHGSATVAFEDYQTVLLAATRLIPSRCKETLLDDRGVAYLLRGGTVLENIPCHLATAHVELAKEPWAVLSNLKPSVKTFALYGERFGGIEPHFKDYKSAAFHVLDSGLRDATALTCLFMLLDSAYLIALIVGMSLVQRRQHSRLDWHGQRGLSFLQLGLREIARLSYERLSLPKLGALPSKSPPKAYASQRKRLALEQRIEFNKVIRFSW